MSWNEASILAQWVLIGVAVVGFAAYVWREWRKEQRRDKARATERWLNERELDRLERHRELDNAAHEARDQEGSR